MTFVQQEYCHSDPDGQPTECSFDKAKMNKDTRPISIVQLALPASIQAPRHCMLSHIYIPSNHHVFSIGLVSACKS